MNEKDLDNLRDLDVGKVRGQLLQTELPSFQMSCLLQERKFNLFTL